MLVESYDVGGHNATSVTASRVVVRDDHGNPIMLAVTYGPDQIWCAHADDEDFETVLAALGIEAATVLSRHHIQSTGSG